LGGEKATPFPVSTAARPFVQGDFAQSKVPLADIENARTTEPGEQGNLIVGLSRRAQGEDTLPPFEPGQAIQMLHVRNCHTCKCSRCHKIQPRPDRPRRFPKPLDLQFVDAIAPNAALRLAIGRRNVAQWIVGARAHFLVGAHYADELLC
jgi:hypothetical protein